jgi:hypothetical protein
MAAKTSAIEALKVLVEDRTFTEEIIKKDYKGDTPLHIAGRKQDKAFTDFLMTQGQPGMLELQNDFCQIPQ